MRLPLTHLLVDAEDAALLEPFIDVISDEVNVKSVSLTTDLAQLGRFELAVNVRDAGPRLGGDVQKVIRSAKAGEWTTAADGIVRAAGIKAAARRVRAPVGRYRPRRHHRTARRLRTGWPEHWTSRPNWPPRALPAI